MATITWTWHDINDTIVTDQGKASYVSVYSDGNLLPRVGWIESSSWYRTGAERVPGALIVLSESMEWRRNDGTLTENPNQIDYINIIMPITGGEWTMRLGVYPWADLPTLKAEALA